MIDFAAARRMMVDGQVRPADVTSLPIISAMQDLPRERFMPRGSEGLAYLDTDVAVTAPPGERRMLNPMVLAKLVHAADIVATDHVLDVGSLTGYSAALLARLAGSVVALNDDTALTQQAEANIRALGIGNVTTATGALVGGSPSRGPYDVILLNGSVEIEPKNLYAQLKDGGRMVGILGRGRSAKATLWRSANGIVTGRPIFDAAAPLLPGFVQPPAFAF
jgi:protein-L-isoaspartate(D-aspartate) O-methyltransferase